VSAAALPRGTGPWLLADLGGTNVRFALAEPGAAAPLHIDTVRAYRVAQFPGFAAAARAYAGDIGAMAGNAVIAAAGPVRGDTVQLTNHAWTLSAPQLAQELDMRRVHLLNDFAAVGMSLPLLAATDVLALGPPVPPLARAPGRRTYGVLGPGTGLGVSCLAVQDDTVIGLETEGGHAGFAPTNEDEIGVLRQLMTRFGRVSNERLLCGSGLSNLHQALSTLAQSTPGSAPAAAVAGNGEDDAARPALLAPESITARAQAGGDAVCEHAVRMFCEMLGSVAGDLVLLYGAWNGIYLAGGLLMPLKPWLLQPGFRRRFENKGRFSQAMAAVPVGLITHPQPGLLGAAAFAVRAGGGSLLRDRSGAGAH
jgi:glucokinase